MKKIISMLLVLMIIISSCKKVSTAVDTPKTEDLTAKPVIITSDVVLPPLSSTEAFSGEFTYSAPDIHSIYENQKVHLESKAGNVIQYSWKIGSDIKTSVANPDISFPVHGYYPITLIVTDKDGNTATTTQTINILCNFTGH